MMRYSQLQQFWKGNDMARKKAKDGEPTIIKKYANRRLYDTGRSSYVTLDDLREMIQDNIDFKVIDAKSGKDITRGVLAQIIAEQESTDGDNLLPLNFMKSLITFYGDNLQSAVPGYLESTFDIFVKNQEELRAQFTKPFEEMGQMNGMGTMQNMQDLFKNAPMPPALEELNRQNIAMFEKTMKMFNPFAATNNKSDKDN